MLFLSQRPASPLPGTGSSFRTATTSCHTHQAPGMLLTNHALPWNPTWWWSTVQKRRLVKQNGWGEGRRKAKQCDVDPGFSTPGNLHTHRNRMSLGCWDWPHLCSKCGTVGTLPWIPCLQRDVKTQPWWQISRCLEGVLRHMWTSCAQNTLESLQESFWDVVRQCLDALGVLKKPCASRCQIP